ncbi:hypothetical protein AVEN_173947-1, partial [Araneus ventricosus]
SEGSSSQPEAPLHCFGSDIPKVPTSLQEKGEIVMGQDRDCRPCDPISPIPGGECVFLCPLLCGVLHYRPRTKPIDSRALVGPYSPDLTQSDFHFSPALKSALPGRHFRSCSSSWC